MVLLDRATLLVFQQQEEDPGACYLKKSVFTTEGLVMTFRY